MKPITSSRPGPWSAPRGRRWPRTLAVLGAAWLLAWPGRASGAPPTVVVLVQRDAGDDARALVRIVTDSLRGLQVRLVVEPVPALLADRAARVALADRLGRSLQARAVVFCAFGPVVEVHLYQVLPDGGRLLVRRVEGGGASSAEGRLEIIGAIVLGGVDAILGGGEVGRPVPVTPRPVPRIVPPPGPVPRLVPRPRPARRRVPVALEAGFQVTGLSNQVPVTPGGRLALLVDVHRLVAVGIGYTVSPAITPPVVDSVALTLHRHQVHLLGALVWPISRWRLGIQAGPFLELMQHRAVAARALPEGLDLGLGVEASAVVRLQLTRWLALTAGVGALFMARRSWYPAPVTDAALIKPWPVQPFGSVGLRVRLH